MWRQIGDVDKRLLTAKNDALRAPALADERESGGSDDEHAAAVVGAAVAAVVQAQLSMRPEAALVGLCGSPWKRCVPDGGHIHQR